MKFKLFSLSISLATIFLLVSCTGSREARGYKHAINGSWMLETITTEGIQGKPAAILFKEASFNCFVGSVWEFVSSNGTGTFKINPNGTECTSINRNFRWTIYEPQGAPKQFQFKRMDENNTEMDNGDGFRMGIISVTETQMQLKSNITYEGRPAAYVYNFTKK